MKILLSILCILAFGTLFVTSSAILGKEKCTYGPSYWCSNITNAKTCGAIRHCIKTVWENQHVPEDHDSICQICLDMVRQARDQLESNETMDEIRQVFEGSCDLIPIKSVARECEKLADDFIPELVEALASQMNPQVVCSTAGLCNNAEIDKLLEEYEKSKIKSESTELDCEKCKNIGGIISEKFQSSSRDEILDGFLASCGKLSSFSDACFSLVISYFNDIYSELDKNLNTDKICHMAGVCSAKFHQHKPDKIEIKTKSDVGYIKPQDDIPCELCEQLVTHLRDILIANTTEIEFKNVLEGLCKQTKSFSKECVSIVEQYYSVLYETLVNNLDANGACFMIGVCPKGNNSPFSAPHMPLLPSNQRKLGKNEKLYTNEEIQTMILPIDKLMGPKLADNVIDSGASCTLCQYFLHFVQEELSDPKNEDEIKEVVGKTCEKFKSTIRSSCHQFIELYGDAIVALLVQEIDPRDVCPMVKLCPKINEDVDVFAPNPVSINAGSKPQCPLCVLVVEEAQKYIESSKSEEVAKRALKKVCSKLPPKLQLQCNDFVETYYEILLKKLITDFSPTEICKDITLCVSDQDTIRVGIEKLDHIPHIDIITNEIPDNTFDGRHVSEYTMDSGECMLCVEVVSGAEHKISRGMSKQEVERVLLKECSRFRAYEGICDSFVEKNVDEIIDLLEKELKPKQVCQKLKLCAKQDLSVDEAIIVNVVAVPSFSAPAQQQEEAPKSINDDPTCVLCEFIMTKLEQQLKDKTTQDEIKEAVENICNYLPKSVSKQCTKFVEDYAELIISLVDTVPPKEICQQMGICSAVKKHMTLVGDSECTWGPTHFCGDASVAEKCKATQYCMKRKLGAFA